MSGFEVAGVVLGTLPLVIKAVDAYVGFMKGWGRAASELKSINRQLTTERSKLYNVCDQLLNDVVPQKDIEPMLQDPFGTLWQAEETNKKIRRRLWNSYDPFEKTALEIQGALRIVQERLNVDVSRDGQVKWVEKRWMPREFRKVLYRLDRKDYQDALTTISKGVNDLESLARLSVALEPSRRKRSGGRVIGMLRGLSASLYRALRSSISCQCAGPHDISLRLSPWFAEHGYDDDDEKVVSGTKFRVAISFERDGAGSEEKKIWDEVDIKKHPKAPTVPPTTLPTPPVCLPVVAKSKRARFVAFSKSQTTITSTALKPSTKQEKGATDIRNALADVTRQFRATSLIATEITPISLSHSSTQSFPASVSMTPVDICGTLKRTLGTRPDCYGQLVDSECLENCFGMYPRITDTIGHKTWSIITLDDVLWQKQGLQPLLWLEEKVRLALAVASAVLQLSKTQWLSKPLTKQDIHFFGNNEGPSYQHPFLGRQIPERQNPCATTREDDATALQPNATLFRLGILLLEIILGSTLENLREPHERIEFPGDRFGMIRDSITAHRLLQTRVALINPAYKAVVERCVGCGSSQALDEEGFGERVYSGVVAELEAILDCTRLS